MRLRKFGVLVVLVAALIISACQPKESAPSLAGTSWILVELYGQSVLSDVSVSLNFDGQSISGNDGCNSFGGSYTTDGNSFSVGDDLMSTLMACEDAIMQQAGKFTQALIATDTYKIDEGRLILVDESGNNLAVFKPVSQELSGTSWTVTFVNNNTSDTGVVASSDTIIEQTIAFDAEGEFNGNAGCNSYFGNYEVEGNELSLDAIGSTKMACPEEVMKAETDYLAALEKADTYQIMGYSLQILDADGNILVTFTK